MFSFGMVMAQVITRLEPGEDFWNREQTGDLGLDDEEFASLVPAAWWVVCAMLNWTLLTNIW